MNFFLSLNRKVKTNIYLISLGMFKLSAVKSRLFSDQVLAAKKGQIWACLWFSEKRNTIYFKSK